MSEIGMNNEWTKLTLRADYLRGRCAEEVEEYMHLTGTVGPNLKADYMVRIGSLEHQVYQLKLEITRWQRLLTLRQQALNKGAVPNFVAIEAELDDEFKAYMDQVKAHQEELLAAAARVEAEKMSPEATNALRVKYLGAVKKLHPDINPNLPSSAKDLWVRIQKAYDDKEWEELEFLTEMVEDVVDGKKTVESADGLAELKKEIERLEKRLKELATKRQDLRKKEPFCWEDFLVDPVAVQHRQASLQLAIDQLQAAIKTYEEHWGTGPCPFGDKKGKAA